MSTLPAKRDRIGARVPHEVYQTLSRAAELSGATINQFLVQSALKEAYAVIEREQVIRLSEHDWDWLLKQLDTPTKPNAALQSARARYDKAKRNHADSGFDWQP